MKAINPILILYLFMLLNLPMVWVKANVGPPNTLEAYIHIEGAKFVGDGAYFYFSLTIIKEGPFIMIVDYPNGFFLEEDMTKDGIYSFNLTESAYLHFHAPEIDSNMESYLFWFRINVTNGHAYFPVTILNEDTIEQIDRPEIFLPTTGFLEDPFTFEKILYYLFMMGAFVSLLTSWYFYKKYHKVS